MDEYKLLKKEYKDYIIFIKSGRFYRTFCEDAIIVNIYFDYKIIDKRVGFPESVLEKCVRKMNDNGISCVIKDNDIFIKQSYFNNYDNELLKAKKLLEKNNRINELMDLINNKISINNNNYVVIKDFINGL